MRISVKTAECVGIAVFGFKNDCAVNGFDKSALTGDAKFGGEIRMNMGDGVKRGCF